MKRNYNLIKAKFFRGLSDSTRLSILETLVEGERSVGEIVELTRQLQSNVSNHLKCLSECGFVISRREGKNILYSLRDDKTKELLQTSEEVISKAYSHIRACLNYGK